MSAHAAVPNEPSPKAGHSCRACPQVQQPHEARALNGALGVAAALSGERGCRPFPRTPFPTLSQAHAKAAIGTGFLQATATVNGLPVVSNQLACVRYSNLAPPAQPGRATPRCPAISLLKLQTHIPFPISGLRPKRRSRASPPCQSGIRWGIPGPVRYGPPAASAAQQTNRPVRTTSPKERKPTCSRPTPIQRRPASPLSLCASSTPKRRHPTASHLHSATLPAPPNLNPWVLPQIAFPQSEPRKSFILKPNQLRV